MVSTLVVAATLIMAAGFSLVYWLRPQWRARIEQPKHQFQEQVRQYDNRAGESRAQNEEIP